MSGYCGFDGWPACESLAETGGDLAGIVVLVVAAVALIGLGIAAHARGRS